MKKFTKRLTLTAIALVFVGVIATSAFGFGWGRGPGLGYGPCGGGDIGAAAGVALTADQKAKIDELRTANLNEIEPLRQQMFTKRDELRALWLEATPDQAKIAAVQQEMRALRDQIQDKMTAFRLAVSSLLTPEQKEKIKTFTSRSGRGPGRGFGPGAGGGCFGGGLGFGPAAGVGPAVNR